MDATKTHSIHELKNASPLIGCRFDPSGEHVFVSSEDYRVWRWHIASGKKTELNVNAWSRGMAFLDKGKTIVTAGYDGRLIWWPVEGKEPKPIRTLNAHDGWIRAIAASPDGTLLASVGNDRRVRLWDAANGKRVLEMPGHDSHIYNVAFHPEGKRLATGDLMANVMDWEISTGRMMRTWKAESLVKFDTTFVAYIGGFRGMIFSKDGKQLAGCGMTNVTNAFAGTGNPAVIVFDWDKGEISVEHLSKKKVRGVAWGVALHPNGTTIGAVGGSGGYLLFWKPGEKDDFHQLKLKNNARDLDLSPDGLQLATADSDGYLRIYRMEEKKS